MVTIRSSCRLSGVDLAPRYGMFDRRPEPLRERHFPNETGRVVAPPAGKLPQTPAPRTRRFRLLRAESSGHQTSVLTRRRITGPPSWPSRSDVAALAALSAIYALVAAHWCVARSCVCPPVPDKIDHRRKV